MFKTWLFEQAARQRFSWRRLIYVQSHALRNKKKHIRCKLTSPCKLWKFQFGSSDQHPRGGAQRVGRGDLQKCDYSIQGQVQIVKLVQLQLWKTKYLHCYCLIKCLPLPIHWPLLYCPCVNWQAATYTAIQIMASPCVTFLLIFIFYCLFSSGIS